MKNLKGLFIVASISCIIYVSCGEETTTPPTTNKFFVTPSKLKTLDPQTEGLYEAWVSFDTAHGDHNESKFNSMGKFNVDAAGNPVDPVTLNAATFKFKKPYVFDDAKDALITLEPPNDNDTTPGTHMLGGNIAISSSSMDGVLTVEGEDVFGHVGEHFFEAGANFMLNTPTTLTDTDYYEGIWTCDTTGLFSLFDSLLAIPDTLGWIYEGWVVDTTISPFGYYSIGRFFNPNTHDTDYAGDCRGILNNGYNSPGEDWVVPNCSKNLISGKYQFWITIEPSLESGQAFNQPFFMRIFQAYGIPTNMTKGQVIPGLVHNVASTYLPSTVIKVLR